VNADDIFFKRRVRIIRHKKTRWGAGFLVLHIHRPLSKFSSRETSKSITPTGETRKRLLESTMLDKQLPQKVALF